jgi:hypothetical protein
MAQCRPRRCASLGLPLVGVLEDCVGLLEQQVGDREISRIPPRERRFVEATALGVGQEHLLGDPLSLEPGVDVAADDLLELFDHLPHGGQDYIEPGVDVAAAEHLLGVGLDHPPHPVAIEQEAEHIRLHAEEGVHRDGLIQVVGEELRHPVADLSPDPIRALGDIVDEGRIALERLEDLFASDDIAVHVETSICWA